MTAGAYGANPILSAWMANNSEPHYRHATSVALGVFAVNSVSFGYKLFLSVFFSNHFPIYQGGIFSTWSFPTKDGPKFRKTTIINLVLYVSTRFLCIVILLLTPQFVCSSIILIVGSLINMAYLSWRNKVKKRPGVRAKLLEKYVTDLDEKGISDDGRRVGDWMDLGDRHPDFVYTL